MSSVYGGKQLADAFRNVRKNTIQVAEDIPEDKYEHVAAPEVRSVKRMLTHVAISPRIWEEVNRKGLTTLVGFDFFAKIEEFHAEEAKPRTKAEIIQWLRESGEDHAKWLETLKEDFLAQVVKFPAGGQPPTRTRFDMLLSTKEHEMHHRAQLMVIERLLGIKPHLTRRQEERMAAMQQGQQARHA
jgi:uncharacterized damage-inducible protein DinB